APQLGPGSAPLPLPSALPVPLPSSISSPPPSLPPSFCQSPILDPHSPLPSLPHLTSARAYTCSAFCGIAPMCGYFSGFFCWDDGLASLLQPPYLMIRFLSALLTASVFECTCSFS